MGIFDFLHKPSPVTATAAIGPTVQQEIQVASFLSILSDIGNVLKKVFTAATTIAKDAEPIVAIALPGISALYNLTVGAVIDAENAAIAAGSQTGTGAQKLALVVNAIEASYQSFATANGITYSPTQLEAWINAVVASLNSIPAASTTAPVVPAA